MTIQTTNEITLEMHSVNSRYNRLLSMHNKLKQDSEETIKYLKEHIKRLEREKSYVIEAPKVEVKNEGKEVVKYLNDKFNVDITRRCRLRELVEVRMIYAHIMRKYTSLSLNKIGANVGLLDHSSIINLLKKCGDIAEFDKRFRSKLTESENYVKENIFNYDTER